MFKTVQKMVIFFRICKKNFQNFGCYTKKCYICSEKLTNRTLRTLLFSLLAALLWAACSRPETIQPEPVQSAVQQSAELSNHRIQAITQDSSGYIWFATYRGLNRYDGHEMHQYFCNDQPDGLPDNQVRNVYCDRRGRLWIATKNGIAHYTENDTFLPISVPNHQLLFECFAENSRGDLFVLQPSQVMRYDSLSGSFVEEVTGFPFGGYSGNQLLFDAEDNLWVVNAQGAFCYSGVTHQQLIALDCHEHSVEKAAIIEGRLWLACRGQGIRFYDIGQRQWCDAPLGMALPEQYEQASVTSIYPVAGRQVVLVGTSQGIFHYNLRTGELKHQTDPGFPFDAPDFSVTHILYDRACNLWLCNDHQGYVVRSQQERTFNADNYLRTTFAGKPVASVTLQDSTTLWIATHHDGLWSYQIGSHRLRCFDHHYFEHYLSDLSDIELYYVTTDSQGNLWVSCLPGLVLCLHPEGDELRLVGQYAINMPIVIAEAADGTLCVGTYSNSYFTKRRDERHFEEHRILNNNYSYMANLLQLRDGRFAALVKGQALRFLEPGHVEFSPQVLSDEQIAACVQRNLFLPTSLCQDRAGDLWIGTVSNGLMHYAMATGELTNIPDAPCEDIASIEEDRQGNIWVSTQHGLGCYDPRARTFINYYKSDGLNGNEFYDRCSCRLPNGQLVFGGEHGLTVFSPERLATESVPRLHFENLRIHNRLVRPSADGPITSRLSSADVIRLNHDQNNFSISYSSLDFGEGVRYAYQYRLEGFSSQWVDVKQSHEAFFSNIPPGDYRFQVRVTSREQQRILAERSIAVTLSPAPWSTWWAKLCYTLLALAIVWQLFHASRRIRTERWNRLQTERDREHERRINTMNMSFFANVSHEFRTPLTIIAAPIAQLLRDETLPRETRSVLAIVQRSVERMLRLVNQMMDFHKLEDDALQLEVQPIDLVHLVADIVESFQLQAREKRLQLTASGLEEPFVQWADADKIEKIVYNLLGNALKYTPSGGHVDLAFDVVSREELAADQTLNEDIRGNRFVKICVSDNGPGIPESELHRVFQRFYQLSRQQNGAFNWGTGIGLYYCSRLVRLHHGQITVANREGEGTGAIFTVLLPADAESYADAKHLDEMPSQVTSYPLRTDLNDLKISNGQNEKEQSDDTRPLLLVVDDDVEIVSYLKSLLRHTYRIRTCYDADSAIADIQEEEPDLILSDVMMPVKDGYQLCREVKNNMQLCHIPIVLLTAKTTTSDQIQGLDCGADAYVSKPFDPTYLQTLVSNILKNREKVRQLLIKSTQTETLAENVLSPQDNAFMTELYAIMEKELANPDLDINHLTEIMRVSRTKLYYKIKGLTGEKPGNFFRLYKLNRAAELIREGRYNVSEISLLTGFSSLSYFSTCFKKQFGVSPSEFK